MNDEPRVLLLGGTGTLGRALARRLGPTRAVVTGARRLTAGDLRFDATTDDPAGLLDGIGPLAGVCLLFGMTAPDECARRPDDAWRLNVEATGRVIDACDRRRLPVIFTSSEVVFDGARGAYDEEDQPAPLMTYGRHKVLIEERLAGRSDLTIVARCARVVGVKPGDGTLFTDIMTRLAQGETVAAAVDQRFSPVLDDDAAAALLGLLERRQSGTYHVAGPETAGRFDMAARCRQVLIDRGVTNCGRVEPRRLADFPTLEPRPRDVSLRIDRLVAALDFRPADLATMIAACPIGAPVSRSAA